MEWQRLYSNFFSHEKTLGLPLGALGLWVKGMAWVGQQETEGFIPASVCHALLNVTSVTRVTGLKKAEKDSEKYPDLLVESGLWETTSGGYLMHDYGGWQAPGGRRKELNRIRQARHRERRNDVTRDVTRDSSVSNAPVKRDGHVSSSLFLSNLKVKNNKNKESPSEDVTAVFVAWAETQAGRRRTLTADRRRVIATRLREGFTAEELCDAVRGWQNDPWAERPRNCDLTLLLRNVGQVEKFRDLWRNKPPSNAEAKAQRDADSFTALAAAQQPVLKEAKA